MDQDYDIYENWKPAEILADSIDLRSLQHDSGTLVLIFEEWASKNRFKIIFGSYFAYRVTIESGRMKSLDNPTLKMFGQTQNSEYLRWFKGESNGIYDDRNIIHYSIVYLDGIIDVITIATPIFERIDRSL